MVESTTAAMVDGTNGVPTPYPASSITHSLYWWRRRRRREERSCWLDLIYGRVLCSGSGHMAMGGGAMRKPLVPCATLLAITSLLHELSYARGRSSLLLPRLGRRLPHHRQLLLEVLKVLDPVAARQAAGHERRRGTAARPPHPSLKAYGTTDPPLASCYAFILSSSASYFKKHISCSMQPSNLSNDYIAFQMERIRKAVV